MAIEQPNYYMVIPSYVWNDKELLRKPKAILLYGHISTLANKSGYCWATNEYFAKCLGVDKRTIIDNINLLKKKKYIKRKIFYKKDSKQVEKRIISIFTTPSDVDFTTPSVIDDTTPSDVDFTENNININNTSNNNNNSIDNNIDTNKNELSGCGCVFEFFEKNVGMLSPFLREDIQYEYSDWLKLNEKEAGAILIKAMEIAVAAQAKQKWRYAKAILKSWKERNIHTLNAIELDNEENSKSRKATKPKDTNRKYHF